MSERAAYIAIRNLSVDVANLTARTALQNANAELILGMKDGLDPNVSWVDGNIPPEEIQKVRALLDALEGLR